MSLIPKVNVSFGGETVEFMDDKSMSDYIKREDAENAILGRCDESALWAIRRLPSADVVEVVRCNDCKYEKLCCRNIIDDPDGVPVQVDYCSHGERKEQEHEHTD